MHLPDGLVSNGINLALGVVSVAVCSYAAKKVRDHQGEKNIPLLGLSIAFIFVAQWVNFPVTSAASGHLLGAVLVGALLGPWFSCLILTLVIVLQRLIFDIGGLASLGTNIFNMAVLGGVVGYWLLWWLKGFFPKNRSGFGISLGVAAWTSVILVGMAGSLELLLSGATPVLTSWGTMFYRQALIGLGEAAVTIPVALWILNARPDLVVVYCCGQHKDACYTHHHHVTTHTHPDGHEGKHGHLY